MTNQEYIDNRLATYNEAFDFYMDCGEMPKSIEKGDILGAYLKSVIDSNPQLDSQDPLWMEVLKDDLLAFLSAIVAGGLYAWIPAVLKVKLKVSEVITTIMLNSVAIYVCTYLVNSSGPLATHDKGVLGGSDAVPEAFRFAQLIPKSNLSTAIFYSAVIAFLCWYIMQKTSIGLEMKVTGENERFAFFAGLPKDKLMIWSMVASGAICGLVGMFEVYGYQIRFQDSISNEFYYDGMLVAMIMNYNPVGIIIMSFFFAVIDIGASAMEFSTGVSGEISEIIFAVIIFLMAAEKGISKAITKKNLQRKVKKTMGKEVQ